jgi:hypothetical protein
MEEDPEILLKTLNTEGITILDQDYTLETGCHFISVIIEKRSKLNFRDDIFVDEDFVLNYDYTRLCFSGTIVINAPSIEKLKEFIIETDIEIWLAPYPNLPTI